MSDKLNRKIVEQYAELSSNYVKLLMGLGVPSKKYESEVLAKLSVNELKIEDVQEEITWLETQINSLNAPEETSKPSPKRK